MRQRREQVDGLSARQRLRLLARWRAEGRTCAYCPRPVECVDHLMPLFRGGTNRVNNLAPACTACNSSKGAKLISEWRREAVAA